MTSFYRRGQHWSVTVIEDAGINDRDADTLMCMATSPEHAQTIVIALNLLHNAQQGQLVALPEHWRTALDGAIDQRRNYEEAVEDLIESWTLRDPR